MNHPEVAILSVGRIAERPVVRDGAVVAAPIGYVSVTFDHRVVDGARAAEFGLAVIRRLEAVERLGAGAVAPGRHRVYVRSTAADCFPPIRFWSRTRIGVRLVTS